MKERKEGCSRSFEWKKRSLDVLGKISSMKEETWPIKDVGKDEYLDWNQNDLIMWKVKDTFSLSTCSSEQKILFDKIGECCLEHLLGFWHFFVYHLYGKKKRRLILKFSRILKS